MSAFSLRRLASQLAELGVRFYELVMIAVGLTSLFVSDKHDEILGWIAIWDLLAAGYLIVGGVAAKRRRLDGADAGYGAPRPWLLRLLSHYRVSFLFALATSLTGLNAALSVITGPKSGDLSTVIKAFCVPAIVMAWMLLHAGYARFYSALYFRPGELGGGLVFPADDGALTTPGRVDFLYFALTMGATFAVSDVNITRRHMRWHVTVHSVTSFFYNAAVLALAIKVLTGG